MSSLPLNLYTAAQVRAADRHAIERLAIPGYTLMCRAGAAALAVLMQAYPPARRVVVVCGAGNNGGDGYVIARLAKAAGFEVAVCALADPATLKGDAHLAYQECVAAGIGLQPLDPQMLRNADVVVDAIFGIGLDRPLDGPMAAHVEVINSNARAVLAVDLPSGIEADTGAVMGAAVRASHTVSFIGLKLGCFTGDGPEYAGRVHFSSLQVAVDSRVCGEPAAQRMDAALLKEYLPRRERTSHKGDFGRVLIVGGGRGMPGAVRLCGEACLRSGAGLVTAAARAENAAAIVAARPELMCHGIEDAASLQPLLDAADVVAVGPGLGRDGWAQAVFAAVLASNKPAVIDADGLNVLALNATAHRRGNWILTPHPGEAARLLGVSTTSIQRDRPAALRNMLERFGGTIVLKGAGSLIGTAEHPLGLCDRGNPGMATAGMGDVLTGIVAALWAQLRNPWIAAQLAVLAHAMAADAAAAEAGERGLIASDVIAQLRSCLNPR